MARIESPVATDVVDPCFIPYVLEHRIRTFILNGTDPVRICRWLRGEQVRGTRDWYNLLKVLKEIL